MKSFFFYNPTAPIYKPTIQAIMNTPITDQQAPDEFIGVMCGRIAERFKGYSVITTPKEIDDAINAAMEKSVKEQKLIWAVALRRLSQYTDEELNRHYRAGTQEWSDWCVDVVLFFAFNLVVFNKRIPISAELTPELNAEARRRQRDIREIRAAEELLKEQGWCECGDGVYVKA